MINKGQLPLVAITMGDAAGIGPQVIVKALSLDQVYQWCRPLIIGDLGVLEAAAQLCEVKLNFRPVTQPAQVANEGKMLAVLDLKNVNREALVWGELSVQAGQASIEYIKQATSLALAGKVDAICTAPINKEAINAAGHHYAGHTQLRAELTRTKSYVMILDCSKLRVALVTTHMPLAEVSSRLSCERVVSIARTVHNSMGSFFNLKQPRLALCAFNPHGGEGGLFGYEERDILQPAVRLLQAEGINIQGPSASDTLFVKAVAGGYDAVISLYHDQGLIPIKLLGFGAAVNLTLGLPIIRTSVDHGTAFDIAALNQANPGSLLEAIRLAAEIVVIREQGKISGG